MTIKTFDDELIKNTEDVRATMERVSFERSCLDMGWRWEVESLGLHYATLTAPVVTGDTCYVAGYSTDSLFPDRKVVEHNGVITVVDRDVELEHTLVALATDSGRILWSVDTGLGGRTTISGPESIAQFGRQIVIVDGTVVIGARAVAAFAA